MNAEPGPPQELYRIEEVCRLAKRNRASVYRDIAAGRLRTVKVGSSTRVPRAELERYLAGSIATIVPPTPIRRRPS